MKCCLGDTNAKTNYTLLPTLCISPRGHSTAWTKSDNSNCTYCVGQSDCGWCATDNLCIPGSALGSTFANIKCSDSSFTWGSCKVALIVIAILIKRCVSKKRSENNFVKMIDDISVVKNNKKSGVAAKLKNLV
ncbi:hypothetical protein ROZALSC1DRAFT_21233 [Rozella allomycis CSF55]|uniref:PSI domain-containing protein n=1 Tax=Rozella allomycis (strain CSF55) TaxID=988480 RepID=A0A4P9YNM9_ROZAC|nr:hypothetical protein ROZALSC1DRAFT_21233 [Rozella allomycis CSF55]